MSLGQTNVKPQDEDFEPTIDWHQDEEAHTLCVMLPGFTKEQLTVQITPARILRLSGERKTSENKRRRFHKELSIPDGADTGGIRAKFEKGVLYVRFPKKEDTTTAPSKADEAPSAQVDQQKPRDQKTEPQTPPPIPTHEPPQDEQKYYGKKQMKEKGKVEERDAKKDAKGERAEATTSRSPTLELVSRQQTQEYKSAVYGLVEEIKKQKKLANLVLVILFVSVFVLYVNNAIKSYFGGSKSQEL